jgi:hypothetical protein
MTLALGPGPTRTAKSEILLSVGQRIPTSNAIQRSTTDR